MTPAVVCTRFGVHFTECGAWTSLPRVLRVRREGVPCCLPTSRLTAMGAVAPPLLAVARARLSQMVGALLGHDVLLASLHRCCNTGEDKGRLVVAFPTNATPRAATEHGAPAEGAECPICFDDITPELYAEFKVGEDGAWEAATVCSTCIVRRPAPRAASARAATDAVFCWGDCCASGARRRSGGRRRSCGGTRCCARRTAASRCAACCARARRSPSRAAPWPARWCPRVRCRCRAAPRVGVAG